MLAWAPSALVWDFEGYARDLGDTCPFARDAWRVYPLPGFHTRWRPRAWMCATSPVPPLRRRRQRASPLATGHPIAAAPACRAQCGIPSRERGRRRPPARGGTGEVARPRAGQAQRVEEARERIERAGVASALDLVAEIAACPRSPTRARSEPGPSCPSAARPRGGSRPGRAPLSGVSESRRRVRR